MATQTLTRAAESDLEPAALYKVLAEANNIPRWAPVFADAIERIDEKHYRVTKNGETFSLEVFLHPSAFAVDYLREMSNNRRGGAFIRVTPRPISGSSVAITVPLAPGTTESAVAKTVAQELADLIRIAQP
jgi:hypothetical protein